jgi:hypothetical protein
MSLEFFSALPQDVLLKIYAHTREIQRDEYHAVKRNVTILFEGMRDGKIVPGDFFPSPCGRNDIRVTKFRQRHASKTVCRSATDLFFKLGDYEYECHAETEGVKGTFFFWHMDHSKRFKYDLLVDTAERVFGGRFHASKFEGCEKFPWKMYYHHNVNNSIHSGTFVSAKCSKKFNCYIENNINELK